MRQDRTMVMAVPTLAWAITNDRPAPVRAALNLSF
jgi:hypothetical protein